MTPAEAIAQQPDWTDATRADLRAIGIAPTDEALLAYVRHRLLRPNAVLLTDPDLGERALVAPSPFDTIHLGVRVASLLAVTPNRDDHGPSSPRVVADWAAANADLLIGRFPLASLATIQALEDLGFRLMDVQTPLARRLTGPILPAPRDDSTRVGPIAPDDVEEIVAIAAGAFRDSHLYANRRLDSSRCDALYAAWVRNDCAGRAFVTLKATWQGEIIGFVAGVDDPVGDQLLGVRRAHIDLVVTKDSWRGRGVGAALVQHGLAEFANRGVAVVTVATQATNTGAIRLYLSQGFRLSPPNATLHRWTVPDRREL